jgi:hypothetical protein
MSEFGYIPESPEQSFQNNKGIFKPKDIYDLTRADKYTNYGQLELIETQTISGTPTTVNFTNIKGNIYNVHFFTFNNIKGEGTTATDFGCRYSQNGGSSYNSFADYHWAFFDCRADGNFNEYGNTNSTFVDLAPDLDKETNATVNGYAYFYNLADSTKYSFTTSQNFLHQSAVGGRTRTGSTVFVNTDSVNAIQFMSANGGGFSGGTMSLYGIRYS